MKPKSSPLDQEPVVDRRQALKIISSTVSALGSAVVFGCADDDDASAANSGTGGSAGHGSSGAGAAGKTGATAGTGTAGATGSAGAGSDVTSCHTIADETSGPYPDTMSMISDKTYFRSDISEGKAGTPLTLELTLVDTTNDCSAIDNANIEIWHCDNGGVYSEYANAMNAGSTTTTYMRGVQTTDASGKVTFKTIFPGWYTPRATHVHIQVYSGTVLKKTTQIGFPEVTNNAVYDQAALYAKGRNATSNDTDQVFGGTTTATGNGDGGGHDHQIAEVTGSVNEGFVATIAIGIAGFA
jgi:protocatechuate 3,4-dioxygenase beta subunit